MTDRYRRPALYLSLLVLLAALLSPLPSAAAPRQETVVTRGMAQVLGGKDVAREQALSQALRQAVRQALGVMVEAESLVRNEVLVTDQVLSRSNGLVKSYSIVSESENDGVYSVEIRAVVSEVKLKKALDGIGLTVRRMGKPRIMLLVSESKGEGKGKPAPTAATRAYPVAQTRIHNVLIRKGFEFIDGAPSLTAMKKENALFADDPSSAVTGDALARVAKSGDAEVAVIATATARSASNPIAGTAIYPCQATVSARAVNTDNGEILASHTAQAAAPHINPATGEAEALGKAAEEVADRLSQQILSNWKGKVDGARVVRLVVSGLDGYDDVKSLKKTMKDEIEELEEIWERTFEAGSAKMDLEIASSSRNLAERLSSLSIQGKPIKITSFTANVVEISIGKRKGPGK